MIQILQMHIKLANIGVEHFVTLLTPCPCHEEIQMDRLQGLRSTSFLLINYVEFSIYEYTSEFGSYEEAIKTLE